MNGEARNDGVELTEVGQRFVQVVLDDPNFISAIESLAGGVQHGGGKVESNAFHGWPVNPDQGQKPAISGSEIKNPRWAGRYEIEKDRLAFRAMRNPICSEGVAILLDFMPPSASRILDLGTGDGRLLALIRIDRPAMEGVALDFSPT